jgi:tetratricopeptide (TPR) repeat protein
MSPVNVALAKRGELRPLILAAICSVLLPRTIAAQPVTPGSNVADARSKSFEARRHFKQGREFLDANAYSEAVAEFETALSLLPLPELLFNIAQAYRLKGDARHALQMYARFVEVIPDGSIADEARAHIAVLTKEIADAEHEADTIEVARRQHDAEREELAHRRRTGEFVLGMGGALAVAGVVLANVSEGGSIGSAIGSGCIVLAVAGAFPYGALKILYNPDPGPFMATPTITRGVAFAFSF